MAMAELRLGLARTVAAQVISIKAMADPQTLPRITGLLAQLAVMPDTLRCQRDGDYLCIDMQIEAIDLIQLDLLLAKLRSIVVVQRAALTGR